MKNDNLSAMRLLFLTFFLLFISSFGFTQEKRNMQLWNINSVSVKLLNKTFVEVSEKIIYSTENSNISSKNSDFWLKHNTRKWFRYGAGFRLSYSRSEFGWAEELRPMVIGEVIKNREKYKFILSNRFEYRWFEHTLNYFRYRQRLDINFPSITPLRLKFFTSEELFIKMNKENLHIARLYAGLNTFDNDHFHLKVYYIFDKSKSLNHWKKTDILGLNMNILL